MTVIIQSSIHKLRSYIWGPMSKVSQPTFGLVGDKGHIKKSLNLM